jgi:hypothetical protein
MNPHAATDNIERLVDSLVRWAGSGALIIDHMTRYAERAPVEGTLEDALTRVLRSVLEPLRHTHAAADLEAAAAFMAAAVEQLQAEILLVEPGAFDDEAS